MSASLGPFLTCFFMTIVLIAYMSFIIYFKKDILYEGMKFTFIVIVLIMGRMLIPFNFPFTITIGLTKILPRISRILFYHIGGTDIRPADILAVIWIVEAIKRLLRMFRKNQEFRRFLAPFRVKDISRYPEIKSLLEEYHAASMPVCIVSAPLSPKIVGVWKPILVIPELDLTEEELEFACRHELEHYKNHDLWLKLFVDLTACKQWFNPLVELLQDELILAFEMSNDNKVLKDSSKNQRMAYILGLIKVAKFQREGAEKQGLSFTLDKDKSLMRRTYFIAAEDFGKKRKRGLSIFLRYIIVVVMLVVAFVFVLESWGVDEATKIESFGYEQECYIIKTDSEYKLYVDGQYVISLSPIPEEFKNVPIIEEEDMK